MIDKNDVIQTTSGLYRVVADYSQVETPLDYELVNVNNESDDMMVAATTVKRSFNSGRWKKVNLDNISRTENE